MRIAGMRVGWLRRRWWVMVLSAIAVTAIALVIQPPQSTKYSAEALLIVRSGATTNTPGSANEANRLAVTYAQLIPQDSLVLDRAGRSLNTTHAVVQKNLTVTNDSGTSILRVRYTTKDSQSAVNGARALADALAGTNPASSNFNGLAISRLPDTADAISPSSSTLPIGVILGLCLGVVLILAWERADGRIEDISDLEQLLSCPVSGLQGMSTTAITALLDRWAVLAHDLPAQVALIAAAPGLQSLTAEIATVLGTSAIDLTGNTTYASPGRLSLHSAGAPHTSEVGEGVAQRCDLTVIVVAEGTAVGDVRKSVVALANFGVKPGWALLAPENVVRRAQRNHADSQAVVVDVGSQAPSTDIEMAPLQSTDRPS